VYLVAGTATSTTPAALVDHLPTCRARHYPSDTGDAEWAVLAPHVPAGTGCGRPIVYPRRDVVDAIRYLDRTGCQWDALPADFPHPKLVYHYYFKTWAGDGTLTRMHNHLREQVRQHVENRERQPSAVPVGSQSLRGAETVGRSSRGYDAGKKANGRKRHIAVDTCGLLLAVLVTGAGMQDRDGARALLWVLRACFPGIHLVSPVTTRAVDPVPLGNSWADSGYAGQLVGGPADQLRLTVQIVTKLAGQTTFVGAGPSPEDPQRTDQ
jgi:transposase